MSHLKHVAALAAIGGLTYFIYAFVQEENITTTTRDDAAVREQRRFRIGEIENPSPTRGESGSTGSSTHEAPPTQPATDLANEDQSNDESQESAHQLGLRVGAAVEQIIASSSRDASWESSVASAFDRAIVETDAAVTVRQVQCSTQYCAVAFDHPHREATRELFFAARTDSALSGEALVRRDQSSDGYTTWVFVAKEDQPLPLEASGG
ncbi:MAG: hypothetical protein MUE69_25685 [Myxococcota bacterium]|jgi:hypothetical protein|nr:hypothetical protein [Myxococcota bacterium]